MSIVIVPPLPNPEFSSIKTLSELVGRFPIPGEPLELNAQWFSSSDQSPVPPTQYLSIIIPVVVELEDVELEEDVLVDEDVLVEVDELELVELEVELVLVLEEDEVLLDVEDELLVLELVDELVELVVEDVEDEVDVELLVDDVELLELVDVLVEELVLVDVEVEEDVEVVVVSAAGSENSSQ